MDLTNFILASNIPWVRLENVNLRNFFQKYIDICFLDQVTHSHTITQLTTNE